MFRVLAFALLAIAAVIGAFDASGFGELIQVSGPTDPPSGGG
jgi:hypothetical protein